MRFNKNAHKKIRIFINILLIFFIFFPIFSGEENVGWCFDQRGSHILNQESPFLGDCHSKPLLSVSHKSISSYQNLCQSNASKSCVDIDVFLFELGATLRAEDIDNYSPNIALLSHLNTFPTLINTPSELYTFPYHIQYSLPQSLLALHTIVLLIWFFPVFLFSIPQIRKEKAIINTSFIVCTISNWESFDHFSIPSFNFGEPFICPSLINRPIQTGLFFFYVGF